MLTQTRYLVNGQDTDAGSTVEISCQDPSGDTGGVGFGIKRQSPGKDTGGVGFGIKRLSTGRISPKVQNK
jgi:hypothetical protein